MEELGEAETFAEGRFNSVDYTERGYGVSAQFEEVVSVLDGRYRQSLFPDATELTLRMNMAD